MPLRLLPVVELEPSDLDVPNFLELLDRGEWDAFWEARLAGFNLRPIRPGSWLVPAADFRSEAAFKLLARVHLEWDPASLEPPPELDHIGVISKGVDAVRLQYPVADFERALIDAEVERGQFAASLERFLNEAGAVDCAFPFVRRLVYGS